MPEFSLVCSKPNCKNTNGEEMKRSLREVLAESHVVAVAIAVLLLWSINLGCQALREPLYGAASFLATAIAILAVPFWTFTLADRVMLFVTLSNLFYALSSLSAAWLLSHWVYGAGPLRSLSKYRTKLARRDHV